MILAEQELLFGKYAECRACVAQRAWSRANGGYGTLECDYCQRKHEREAIALHGGE